MLRPIRPFAARRSRSPRPVRSSSLQARIGGRFGFEKHTSRAAGPGLPARASAVRRASTLRYLDRRAGRTIAGAVAEPCPPGGRWSASTPASSRAPRSLLCDARPRTGPPARGGTKGAAAALTCRPRSPVARPGRRGPCDGRGQWLDTGSVAGAPGRAEGCRSGRTGRSRKPLYARAYRGFESHSLRQYQLSEPALRPRIGPLKPRNSAVFRGRLCTSPGRRGAENSLCRAGFSAAVHLGHSVPTQISSTKQQLRTPGPQAGFEKTLG